MFMNTKVANITETTKPEWLQAIDHFLTKDDYKVDVYNPYYITYTKGNFFTKLQRINIYKDRLAYSCECCDQQTCVSKLTEPLTVSTEIDAGVIIAMLQFAGAFSKPIFKGEPFTLCDMMPLLTGEPIPNYEPVPAFDL